MKLTKIILALLLFSEVCAAQTKLLTMEEAVVKQKTTLAPAKLKQLMWVKNTASYSFVDNSKGEELLMVGSAEKEGSTAVATLTEINLSLKKIGLNTLLNFPTVQWKSEQVFEFETEKRLISYDLTTKKMSIAGFRDLDDDAENLDIAGNDLYIAFTRKSDLYVFDGKNIVTPVTADSNINIVNGKSVHRDEFGISKGTYWSPKSDLLAFYRMDQTMVTDYPIIDWTTRPAKNNNIKYPMAGDKSHEVTIGIFNTATHKTVFLKTGTPKDQYLTNIAWSPDEKEVYVAILNRGQNHLWLNCYNATTGDFEKTLFEEQNEKYVHPMHPMMFVTNHPDEFIWQSERDGFNHLYLYNTSGKLLKQLTKGNWLVTDLAGLDVTGENAYYTSTTESAITRNFYSVNLKSGKSNRITSGNGTHTATFNSNYVIDNFQSTEVPREISIYNLKGKKLQVLKNAENPLKDYQLGEMKIFTLKGDAGDELYCRMFKPINFDSTKKYPCIVYLYNGPGIQMVNNTWNGGGDLWFQYMAEHGFVVFTMDGRGSLNRGLAFEQATFRHLGAVEMKDQMKGVDYLKNLRYVDGNRMGLFGWSFGGFMTTSIMTRYPDVFKAAVAGGPVIDWSYYEVMYTERYMDTPQENKDGYAETNVLNGISNLKGKLLIIHGTQDNVVVWQHSLMFLKTAVDKGKQVDYYVYPGHEHNVLGKDRAHLYQKVTDYFMENL